MTKEELSSLVNTAVAKAMKESKSSVEQLQSVLECPECHAKFDSEPLYLDHRVTEFLNKKLKEVDGKLEKASKPLTPENFLVECKDGICKIVSEHVEEIYTIGKKDEAEEEEEPGLFSVDDESEEK